MIGRPYTRTFKGKLAVADCPKPLRTYRQIAEILAARGEPISKMRVCAIEHRALEKWLCGVEKLLRKEGLS